VSLDKEFFEAVRSGDAARVSELLKRGANPNVQDKKGWTPLHWAAGRGYAEIVRLLLEYGADANARDKDARTPLHFASGFGRADVVLLLLEHGADVNAKNKDGRTPLHIAASWGYADVARLLLGYGADVNAKDKDGTTPLHFASIFGHADTARVLLEYGADPSIKDNRGKSPLDVAWEWRRWEVARIIEEFIKRGSAAPSIVSVECSELRVGEWGRLLVRVRGVGRVSLAVEGDVDWINPEVVELSGETVVEVPVRPKAAGEAPVKVCVESSGSKISKIIWLKVVEKAGKCPNCGAQVEPGAKYCWKCGAKLS
jgi:hypothetical protein